jgi:hypothetical protein
MFDLQLLNSAMALFELDIKLIIQPLRLLESLIELTTIIDLIGMLFILIFHQNLCKLCYFIFQLCNMMWVMLSDISPFL